MTIELLPSEYAVMLSSINNPQIQHVIKWVQKTTIDALFHLISMKLESGELLIPPIDDKEERVAYKPGPGMLLRIVPWPRFEKERAAQQQQQRTPPGAGLYQPTGLLPFKGRPS